VTYRERLIAAIVGVVMVVTFVTGSILWVME